MPEIRRFAGYKLLMFFQDENPPHLHIVGPGFAAKMRLSDGEIYAGKAPGKLLRQARRWVAEHRAELDAMWREFQR